MRIQLISGPRNISTALMYSFAQRSDMTVVDEPFYACYLAQTGLEHPGRRDILASQKQDPERVIHEVILADYATPHIFFKNMSKHMAILDASYAHHLVNVFLIREPSYLISSFARVVPRIDESEIGLKASWELFNRLNTRDNPAIVLNSETVLQDPKAALSLLCERLNLSFDEKMLSWKSGPRVEDGVWAAYWYHNVHRSTGFAKPRRTTSHVPEHLQILLAEVRPYYEALNNHSLQIN